MITPPFSKVVWGKKQLNPTPKRVRMWLRRLHRAREIIDCSETRFDWRWQPELSAVSRTLSPFLAELLPPPTLVVSIPRCLADKSKLAWVRVDGSKKQLICVLPLPRVSLAVFASRKARAKAKIKVRSSGCIWSIECKSKNDTSWLARTVRNLFSIISLIGGFYFLR